MDLKKYASLDSLSLFKDLLKNEIDKADSAIASDAKDYSDKNLISAQEYTDNAVSQKAQVQIITWENDDV